MRMPASRAQAVKTIRKIAAAFLPISCPRVVRVAILVAGPRIRNTRAAPGVIPA